jgi:hypothetical protein
MTIETSDLKTEAQILIHVPYHQKITGINVGYRGIGK